MAIIEFNGGPITHRYLMNKTKNDLARMYMELLNVREKEITERDALRAEVERLRGEYEIVCNMFEKANEILVRTNETLRGENNDGK